MRIFTLAITAAVTFLATITYAQSDGDFRTTSGGSWTNPGIWERFNGSTWIPAASAPTASDGLILIQAAHTVAISASQTVTADQVAMAGNLVVDANGTFILANGAGADLSITGVGASLSINGTFVRENLSDISNPFLGQIQVNSGAVYEHRFMTAMGDLPTINWHPNSTLLLTGFANTSPITANATWNQSFGHVTINSPGQRNLVDFNGNLVSIMGNLSVLSTGNSAVQLSDAESMSLSVGGDVLIAGTARIIFGVSGTVNATIGGNFVLHSTSSAASYGTFTGTTTLDLGGNFVIDASTGRFRFAGPGTTGSTTLNLLNGNFQLVSGRIDETGSENSRGIIRFLAAGQQAFLNEGTISGYFNYYIGPQTELDLGNSSLIGASPSSFTLDGGTLILGSTYALGPITSGTAYGNVRTPTAYRTYAPGSTLIYRASGPQAIGTGHPLQTDITTIIDNSSGVSLYANRVLNHPLILASGTLHLNGYILTLNSTVASTGGFLGGTPLSQLIIGGSGSAPVGSLRFNPTENILAHLNMNRAGENVSVSVEDPLVISSKVTLARGVVINNSTISLMDGVIVTRYETSELLGGPFHLSTGDKYNLEYKTFSATGGPFAAYVSGAELSGDPFALGNLTVYTAQTGDNVDLDKSITVNGNFTLTRGRLNQGIHHITMLGEKWNDNTGVLVPGTGWVILAANTAVNGTANPLFGNLRTSNGSNIDFLRNLSVEGDILFEAGSAINFNQKILTLSGSEIQAISGNGATVDHITIAKPGTNPVVLTSPLNLQGVLQFASVSKGIALESNGNLNLLSTSDEAGSGTAFIYRLLNNNQISGNVTVNRYMSGEGRIFRYLSSPVQNATVSQWKDDFWIGGDYLDPSPTQNICGFQALSSTPALFYYDETVAGDIDQGYIAYPLPGTHSTASPLQVGRAYAAFIRRCTQPTIVDMTGPINQGTLNLPVSFTNTGDVTADGWNLVGNPYPSSIDWDLGFTKTRISSMIAIKDNGTGVMRYYDPGVVNDIPGGVIALGQGFFVRATAANPVLRITENSKVLTVGEFFREASPISIPSFQLTLSNGRDDDYAYVKILDEALPGADEFDAPKIRNPEFGLATVTGRHQMAINALPALECGMQLPLSIEGLSAGTYTLALDTRGFFSGFRFVLTDAYTNRETLLGKGQYTFTVTEEIASADFNRFTIRVEENEIHAVTVTQVSACSERVEVNLGETENNMRYALWTSSGTRLSDDMTATGNTMMLFTFVDSLAGGPAELIVKALSGCGTYRMVSEAFMVSRTVPEFTNLTSTLACNGNGIVLSALSSEPGATILWYARENDSNPVFEGSLFEIAAPEKMKTYYAEVVTTSGCRSERKAITTNAVPPTVPVLEVSGNTLLSNYAQGNQWFYEGELIAHATSPSLTMERSGQYTLVVNAGGCEKTLSHYFEGNGLQFYPNPFTSTLNISGLADDVREITLTDALGRKAAVIYKQGQPVTGAVDLAALPDGVYLLRVSRTGGVETHRVVKEQ